MYRLVWDSVGDRYFYLLWKDAQPIMTIHHDAVQVVASHSHLKNDIFSIVQSLRELDFPHEKRGPALRTALSLLLGEEVASE